MRPESNCSHVTAVNRSEKTAGLKAWPILRDGKLKGHRVLTDNLTCCLSTDILISSSDVATDRIESATSELSVRGRMPGKLLTTGSQQWESPPPFAVAFLLPGAERRCKVSGAGPLKGENEIAGYETRTHQRRSRRVTVCCALICRSSGGADVNGYFRS